MSFKQYLLSGVAAAACLLQASCDTGGGPIDLKYPSVADLDAADVRWGLSPRMDKGAPKRAYQYNIEDSGSSGGAPAAPAPVTAVSSGAPEVQTPSKPIPAVPDPQIDVNKLR